jgi:hypothetical protein
MPIFYSPLASLSSDETLRRRSLFPNAQPGILSAGEGVNDRMPPTVSSPTARGGIMPGVRSARDIMPPRLPAEATPDMSNAPLPEFTPRPITRAEELEGAKTEYLAKTPGRFKSGLLGALRGAAQGFSTGGGLAAGLGGALAGGAFGAINPRGERAMEFETIRKPRILERFALEDQEQAARLAEEKARREAASAAAKIADIQSQIESRQAADALNQSKFEYEKNKPLIVRPGGVVFDPRTGEPIFQADKPLTSTDPSLDIEPTSGKSYQQIAVESYMNRGGDDYVLSQMPAVQQELIQKGTINGTPASLEEVNAALRAFEAAKQRQLQIDMDYTRGSVRGGNVSRQKGRRPAAGPAVRKGSPGRTFISVQEAADLLRQ